MATRTPETIAPDGEYLPDDHSTGFSTIRNRFQALTEDLGLRNVLSVLSEVLSRPPEAVAVLGEDYLGYYLLLQDEALNGAAEGLDGTQGDPDCEEDDDRDGVTCKPKWVSIVPLPAGTTANWNTMISYLKTTGHRFHNLKQHRIHLKDCLLMWDNARSHAVTDTRDFLTRRDVEQVKQSPYSPELNLCDRYLFRKLNLGPRRRHTDRAAGGEEVSEDELIDHLR
ncbi:Uncharacterized protein FKW44_021179 [Caligus rogercresseyi]|uniref:Uncharacterized protein n=1 Tax=Caligus rogercresseyi TaxID=217165 RepID=A0A7T8GR43_CALRO|nr:Uncharacterized protein FKW44_021179 [Caligus rogercresseyi]